MDDELVSPQRVFRDHANTRPSRRRAAFPNCVLVVGAGLAGSVCARSLADAGFRVDVIDRRSHVAGNAFDEVDPNGIRVHRYGPHLFHTSNQSVLTWIRRFAEWVPYEHKVRALLPSGELAPLPINLDTLNIVFGESFASSLEAEQYLASVATPVLQPSNAAEYLASKIGTTLRDLFFRPYTLKMWGMELEEIGTSVVKRIPLRTDRHDSYFRETETQLLPRSGYTAFVKSILDHDLIKVSLDTSFEAGMLDDYDYVFSSMAIDEFYGYDHGQLPYRSLRFHHRSEQIPIVSGPWAWNEQQATFSVVNFTDRGPFTRETAWHRLPHHVVQDTNRITLTREEPCDYLDNDMERYYPINDAQGRNQAAYEQYRKRAASDVHKLSFIGRCGTYRYLDMDQVINQTLATVGVWLRSRIEIGSLALAST